MYGHYARYTSEQGYGSSVAVSRKRVKTIGYNLRVHIRL